MSNSGNKNGRRKQNLKLRQDFRIEEPIEILDYAGASADDCMIGDDLNSQSVVNEAETLDCASGIKFSYKKVDGVVKSSRKINKTLNVINSENENFHVKCCYTDNSVPLKYTTCNPEYFKSVNPNSILPNSFVCVEHSPAPASPDENSPPPSRRISNKAEAAKVKKKLENFYSNDELSCKVCTAKFKNVILWCKHLIVLHPAYAKTLSVEQEGDHICERCKRSFETVEGMHYHMGLMIC